MIGSICESSKKRSRWKFVFMSIYFSVFLYSVPGHGSRIKQRMVYASCKESFIDTIEKKFGISIEKKVRIKVDYDFSIRFISFQVEISDARDLTDEHFVNELHPEVLTNAAKTSFTKPKGPATRGARRLVKGGGNPDE